VALPLARPAMAAGVGLVAMEVLNDYGAVKYYGVPDVHDGHLPLVVRPGRPVVGDPAVGHADAVRVRAAGAGAVAARPRGVRGRARVGAAAAAGAADAGGARSLALVVCAVPFLLRLRHPGGAARLLGVGHGGGRGGCGFVRLVANTFTARRRGRALCVALPCC
jgi:hypothetical protein